MRRTLFAVLAGCTTSGPGGLPMNGCYGKLRYSKTYDVLVLRRAANAKVLLPTPPLASP